MELCTQGNQRPPTKSHTWCSQCKNAKVNKSPETKQKRAQRMREYMASNKEQAEKKRIRPKTWQELLADVTYLEDEEIE